MDVDAPIGPFEWHPIAVLAAKGLTAKDGIPRTLVAGTQIRLADDEPGAQEMLERLRKASGWWVIPTSQVAFFTRPGGV